MGGDNSSRPLELTREETYALESVLKNDDTEEGVRLAKPLLLKIGSAFLAQNPDSDSKGAEAIPDAIVKIAVTEKEAWLARDRVPVTMQVGHQPVGLNLKKKIYSILVDFDTEAVAGGIIEGLKTFGKEKSDASKDSPRHQGKAEHDARGAAPKAPGTRRALPTAKDRRGH